MLEALAILVFNSYICREIVSTGGEHEIMRDLIEGFVWCDLITVKVKSPHYAGFVSIHSDLKIAM